MDYIKKTILLLKECPDDIQDWIGPSTEYQIKEFEQILGVELPKSYRHFILEIGAGDFCGLEFYGIGLNGTLPKAMIDTIAECKHHCIPPIIYISDVGNGWYYGLDSSLGSDGEYAVITWYLDEYSKKEIVSSNFGEFLYKSIKDAMADCW